ncbi:site-specific DNA-methyltransferase [Sulfurimonas sp.]|uniref:DNA-methyltransferase n=1 Tax=Sulfurimonas sp. TaxID=2022749 RepID=UPI003564BCE1
MKETNYINKIFNMDCLLGMQMIKDKSIDLILCDLPYGTTKNKWDSVIDLEKLWEQYERIIKDDGAILLFAQSPFDKVLACSNMKLFRHEWIWEKPEATGFLNAEKMPMKAHENILVFYKSLPTYNPIKTKGHKKESKKESKAKCKMSTSYGKQLYTKDYCSTERYPRSVIKFSKDKQIEHLHPTQKPLALIEYFIKTYSNEGEIVLDNCVGSGTTPVGCVRQKRDFIGFDNGICEFTKKPFAEIATERVRRALGQVGLFEKLEVSV